MSAARAEATDPAEPAAPSDDPASVTAASGPRWLQALGLHRRELRGWALYDWANSAFATVIGAAVFPIFYANVAAADLPANEATARYAFTASIALALMALLMPVLGAVADYLGVKKRLLGMFLALGALATATMFFIGRGDWVFASALFVLGNVGLSGANVFYNSLLPHIAREGEVDRVSSAGYALGYLGGGLLLAINLAWILFPETIGLADAEVATRLSFVSVAVWWAGFSIPLFRCVPEPPRRLERDEVAGLNPVRVGVTRLVKTFRKIRGYRHAFLFLLAFLAYNDGIGTINGMAAAYGTEIGLARFHLIGAILAAQFVGMPCTFLTGVLAGRLGAKRTLYLALSAYVVISGLAYFMTTALHFYALAILVGAVVGGSQALSRSLYASLIPRHKSAEFFAFLTVGSKFAGILGPAIFGWVSLLAGSSRLSILAIMAFFVIGMALLTRVDVPVGQRAARRADQAFHSA